jgi:hypothetical protein
MKKLIILTLLMLGACTTPKTILKNDNGDAVTCGGSATGSLVGGMIGYSIEKDNDDKCVKDYIEQGYEPVKIGDIPVNKSKSEEQL